MSRDVCGICWCPYDEDGKCGCNPELAQVLDQYSLAKIKDDEALLRQALEALEWYGANYWRPEAIDNTIAAIKERLK